MPQTCWIPAHVSGIVGMSACARPRIHTGSFHRVKALRRPTLMFINLTILTGIPEASVYVRISTFSRRVFDIPLQSRCAGYLSSIRELSCEFVLRGGVYVFHIVSYTYNREIISIEQDKAVLLAIIISLW